MKTNSFISTMNRVGTKLLMMLPALLLVACTHTKQPTGSSPFEYREVYLPQLTSDVYIPLSLNSIDRDWGIWGHNLSVVLPEEPSPSVYARSGVGVNRDQFCFSSDALFNYISKYIMDNYGKKTTMRFAILPNDNSVVCLCKRCVECGNTESDASGAVYYLLDRLTEKFPKHIFFTSYYRTTCSLPKKKLHENAGVLISAIKFPLSTCYSPMEDDFEDLIKQFSKYTNRIYVWDYINNFDDYFTPFPVLSIFQRRLRLYADAGVKGIFLNGSGHDYSTLYGLKIHAMALLLSNLDADWRPKLREFCREYYPVTGDIICDFVVKQENMVEKLGETLLLYEGVNTAVNTYLPAEDFVRFHNKLMSMLPETKGKERQSIEKLCRAFMFTRLELNRMKADTLGTKRMLGELEKLSEYDIVAYSESGGTIDSYVEDYRYMLRKASETSGKNLLKGVRLEPLTALDQDYNDISILTDGLLGLPSCYHCGQMLSSAWPALRISIPRVAGMKRLRVNMTKNAIYHIAFPLKVSLSCAGRELGSVVPTPVPGNIHRAVAEFDIPTSCSGSLVLSVVRDESSRTMALDEIEGF